MIPFTISPELWDYIVFHGGHPNSLDYYAAKAWAEMMEADQCEDYLDWWYDYA
jgi:hypothetical protein